MKLKNSAQGNRDDGKGDEDAADNTKCANVTLKNNSTRLEPRGEKQNANASFFLFEINSSWSAASAACENGGTQLASLSVNVELVDMVAALNKIRRQFSPKIFKFQLFNVEF
jgi:hypothetical protein